MDVRYCLRGSIRRPAMRAAEWVALALVGGLWIPWTDAAEFRSAWPADIKRAWIGPEYWANRLQDWRLRDGRLECVEASGERPMRTVHLLVGTVGERRGTLTMSVRTGPIESADETNGNSWVGFLVGAGGKHVDYRLTALVHHRPAEDGGLLAALDGNGCITFRDNTVGRKGGLLGPLTNEELPELSATRRVGNDGLAKLPADVELRLEAKPKDGLYTVTLSALDRGSGELISSAALERVDGHRLEGSVALVSHLSPAGGRAGYWFSDWKIGGSKFVAHPERAFGPVLAAQHTLSNGILKMAAQMGPLGKEDTQTAELQIRHGDDESWRTVARARLIDLSYTFPFRVENWDGGRDAQYRIAYDLKTGPGTVRTYYWNGTVRKEPADRDTLVVAAFTGHRIHVGNPVRWNSSGIWFPHNEVVAGLRHIEPDLLFFSGDQVYEGDLTGAVWRPPDKAMLDYLDKWYRWCWAFGDLARDIPCICIPDDHDVYHGNVWGDGGHATDDFGKGGYYMPAEFVKMVERTQTSHLPDPYDPTPIDQGIGVYYTSMNYGGVSFAIIEDRKWKSPPSILPAEADEQHGWIRNADFDAAAHAEKVGARMLGERQLQFLRNWSADWRHGIWMKVVLSQTTFVNLATIPEQDETDGRAVGLAPLPPGEIAEGQKLARDTDSNGWPPPARDKALREMRRAFALHINGDQHLGSVVHYGIDEWEDAGYSFCVPSIGNIWPRRWYPPTPGENHEPGTPLYTGRYRDGFGNRTTVHAVSNPMISGHEPKALYDRATGYGIVRLSRRTREITLECWPRWVDPSKPGAQQYLGWPVRLRQLDNGLAHPGAYLPTLRIRGMDDPVVQVIDETSREVVYTLRVPGSSFRPPVRRAGVYTVKVGELGTSRVTVLEHLTAKPDCDETIDIEL